MYSDAEVRHTTYNNSHIFAASVSETVEKDEKGKTAAESEKQSADNQMFDNMFNRFKRKNVKQNKN